LLSADLAESGEREEGVVGRGGEMRKKMDESLAPLSSMGTKSDPKTTIRWKNQEKERREKSSNPLYYLLLLPPSSRL
jgi:hypothetical protein